MIPTVKRTIPATPISPAYETLCADLPGKAMPIVSYNGRACFVVAQGRTRVKVGYRFYNYLVVRFVDDGSSMSIPAGQFAKGCR